MTDAGGKPKVLRVEFFGAPGAGKSTFVRKLLAEAPVFTEAGISLYDGRQLWREIVRHRSAELIAGHGPKPWLKRRVLAAGYPWGSPAVVASRLCTRVPELDDAFNALLSAYEGTPKGFDFSGRIVGVARDEYFILQCENYWREHIARQENCVLLYDESLVQVTTGLLAFSGGVEKRLCAALAALPQTDLYFHFSHPVDGCRAAVRERDRHKSDMHVRLETIPAKRGLAEHSAGYLGQTGRKVVSIDRSRSPSEVSKIIMDELSKK